MSRRLDRGWKVALVMTGVVSMAAPAHAQPEEGETPPTKSTADSDEEAKRLFEEGDAAYAAGKYALAIAAFEKAYALSGRPGLLFNLANAHERLGDLQAAKDQLVAYLPDCRPGEADAIHGRIAALDQRIEAAAASPPGESEPTPETEPAPQPAPTNEDVPDPVPMPVPATTSDDFSGMQIGGFVMLGLGGAGLVVGSVLGGLALGARGDAEDNCIDAVCSEAGDSAVARDTDLSLAADVTFGVSGAIVVAGVVMVVAGAFEEDEGDSVAMKFEPVVLSTADGRVNGGVIVIGRDF